MGIIDEQIIIPGINWPADDADAAYKQWLAANAVTCSPRDATVAGALHAGVARPLPGGVKRMRLSTGRR